MDVLGVEVGAELLRRWTRWLAPACQPFFLTAAEAVDLGLTFDHSGRGGLPAELRDTYEVWSLDRGLQTVWLDEHAFHAQPCAVRARLVRAQALHGRGAVPTVDGWADVLDAATLRGQADGQRFVWWPTLVDPRAEAILRRVVLSEGYLPCQRASVPGDVWRAVAPVLPRARALSGTFADGSGANCFGTVMAAAGVPDVAEVWVQLDLFEAWLAANRTAEDSGAGGGNEPPGTVLVWRDADGNSQHAAVAIGGGWALHKPSQTWATPRQVLTVDDLVRTAPAGVTLHRYLPLGAEVHVAAAAAD